MITQPSAAVESPRSACTAGSAMATIVTSRTITNCGDAGKGDDHPPGLPAGVTLKHAYGGNTDRGHDAPRRRPPRARARQHDLRRRRRAGRLRRAGDAGRPRHVRPPRGRGRRDGARRAAASRRPRACARRSTRSCERTSPRAARRRRPRLPRASRPRGARPTSRPPLAAFEAAVLAAQGAARLSPGYAWTWDDADPLAPVHRLAHAAAQLLTGPDLALLHCCDACCWLFLDRAGKGRKWCSMADCGTEAKKRRYVERRERRSGE